MQTDLFGPTLTVDVRDRRARRYAYRVAAAFGYSWRLGSLILPVYEIVGLKTWLDAQLHGGPNRREAWFLFVDLDRAFYEASTTPKL